MTSLQSNLKRLSSPWAIKDIEKELVWKRRDIELLSSARGRKAYARFAARVNALVRREAALSKAKDPISAPAIRFVLGRLE